MAMTYIAENVTGDATSDELALVQNQVCIGVSGTFTSVSFEDKTGGDWQPMLFASTGGEVELSEATNQLVLFGPAVCGRRIRASIVGGTDVSIWVDQGAGPGIA